MKPETRQGLAAASAVVLVAGVCLSSGRSEEDSAKWNVPTREAERKNPVPADEKSAAAGKAVYAKNCVLCHGPAGKGDGPKGRDLQPQPTDLTSSQVTAQSEGALYWKITTGRRPMPSFRKELSDEDRWHLVNYIRSLGPAKQSGKKP